MRLLLSLALSLGLGVVVATSLSSRATTERHSDLLPDARVVPYRFAADRAPDDIAIIEARVTEVGSPFEMAELADLYLRRGDREKAEALATKSIAILRWPNPALLVLAKAANAKHDFQGAVALATEVLVHKRSASAYSVIATAKLATGELVAAAEAAETALAIEPSSGGYFTHALVMQAQGRDAEAGFDFTRAAQLEDHGAPAEAARLRALWGRFLMRRGELANAAMLYDEALRIEPGMPLATALKAELALRTGKLRTAATLFERAFASSQQIRYLMDKARAQELAGEDPEPLRIHVERLLRREGIGHRLELVELLLDRGNATEALALAREEILVRPSTDARLQLARALARTNDLDGALSQVRAALATGAREAQLYELASQLEQRRGNAPRAKLYAREARELDPGGSGWRALAVR